MKLRIFNILINISLGVEICKLTKIRAYKRFRLGKIEKVNSYTRKS